MSYKTHSLLVGNISGYGLDRFPATNAYAVSGATHASFCAGGPSNVGYFCARQSPVDKFVYVKYDAGSSAIDQYDPNTGLATGRTVVGACGGANFLVDPAGNLVHFDPFGNIVKSSPVGAPLPNGGMFVENHGRFSRTVTMEWSPQGELCVLNGVGGSLFPNQQAILRFDGNTGAYLGELVPYANSQNAHNLRTSVAFTFGPDGNIYAAKNLFDKGVVRFDGTTGASLGEFINGAALPSGPRDLLFAPNGQTLLLVLDDRVAEFSRTGMMLTEFPIGRPNPGLAAFLTQELPTIKYVVPEYPLPHIIFITELLAGIRSFRPDWIGQAASPLGGARVGAEAAVRVWAELRDLERDTIIAFGQEQLAGLMSNPRAAASMQEALRINLDPALLKRLRELDRQVEENSTLPRELAAELSNA